MSTPGAMLCNSCLRSDAYKRDDNVRSKSSKVRSLYDFFGWTVKVVEKLITFAVVVVHLRDAIEHHRDITEEELVVVSLCLFCGARVKLHKA
jgi:hypothetical protein